MTKAQMSENGRICWVEADEYVLGQEFTITAGVSVRLSGKGEPPYVEAHIRRDYVILDCWGEEIDLTGLEGKKVEEHMIEAAERAAIEHATSLTA